MIRIRINDQDETTTIPDLVDNLMMGLLLEWLVEKNCLSLEDVKDIIVDSSITKIEGVNV